MPEPQAILHAERGLRRRGSCTGHTGLDGSRYVMATATPKTLAPSPAQTHHLAAALCSRPRRTNGTTDHRLLTLEALAHAQQPCRVKRHRTTATTRQRRGRGRPAGAISDFCESDWPMVRIDSAPRWPLCRVALRGAVVFALPRSLRQSRARLQQPQRQQQKKSRRQRMLLHQPQQRHKRPSQHCSQRAPGSLCVRSEHMEKIWQL
mmetsp:Transcript_475/g.945  ORF Transcript_475/g.945 Transcript_475/m.945 type:complete len:206 (-) Transcript_475:241-858(-)